MPRHFAVISAVRARAAAKPESEIEKLTPWPLSCTAGRTGDAPYFNSGVLMFDLQTWRTLDIGHRCIHTAQARRDYWPDQDALNIVLDGRIKALDAKWSFFSTEPLPREACEAAHVLHFIPDKPTSANCRHPMFGDYLAIRATTPWRDRPFASSVRQRRLDQLARTAAERVRRRRESD